MKVKLNKLRDKVKKLKSPIKKIVCTKLFVMDSLFLLGTFIIILTNFIVNMVFGLYATGFTLIAFSMFLNKTKKVGR